MATDEMTIPCAPHLCVSIYYHIVTAANKIRYSFAEALPGVCKCLIEPYSFSISSNCSIS